MKTREIKIEKRIKPPDSVAKFYHTLASNMELGDSALMRDSTEAGRVCGALKRLGREGRQKTEDKGCRVWRTK